MYLRHLVFLLGGLALVSFYQTTDRQNVLLPPSPTPQLTQPTIIFPDNVAEDKLLDILVPGDTNPETRFLIQFQLSTLILCFFAGLAVRRLMSQFRNIILSFLGLFIIFLFVLVYSGLLETVMNFGRLLDIVPLIRFLVSKAGAAPCIAFVLGFFLGGKRMPSVRPRPQGGY